jgi:N utilization substance protein B
VQQHFEDRFPAWDDDVDIVIPRTRQLLQHWPQGSSVDATGLDGTLSPEGRDFARQLLHACIEHRSLLDELVAPRLENWELDRVSLMDRVLLRMALAELLYFDTVPVKVSINEYIDISKTYSGPKSKDFINGVLDKVLQQLKEEGRIRKRGRGLVE